MDASGNRAEVDRILGASLRELAQAVDAPSRTASQVAVWRLPEVLAIPPRMDLHPDLASVHPAGLLPTPVNATVERFVECAWRWHWLLPLLASEQERAGEAEVSSWRAGQAVDETPDPYADYQEICHHVRRRFQEIDPEIGVNSKFWVDIIVDVW